MADTDWSAFTDSAPLGTDIFLAMRGGGGVNFTTSQLAAYLAGNMGSVVLSGNMTFGGDSNLLYQSGTSIATLRVGQSPNQAYFNFRGSGGIPLLDGPSGALGIGTGGVERVRIDGSGNLAIGALPIANTTSALQLVNDVSLLQGGASAIVFNGYYAFSGSYKVKNAGFMSGFRHDVSSGRLGLNMSSATGAAGADVSAPEQYAWELAGYRPGFDNSKTNGAASYRWSVVYAATGSINTSDERAKDLSSPEIPDEWLDAWGLVEWVRYKFKDSIEGKGDGARWHIGLVAQHVRDIFSDHGLDAQEIGLLCYDEWEEAREPILEARVVGTETVVVDMAGVGVIGPDGAEIMRAITEEREVLGMVDTGETRVTLEAGDRWGLRYDECQAIEAAWQRRELARERARREELEAKLAALVPGWSAE